MRLDNYNNCFTLRLHHYVITIEFEDPSRLQDVFVANNIDFEDLGLRQRQSRSNDPFNDVYKYFE